MDQYITDINTTAYTGGCRDTSVSMIWHENDKKGLLYNKLSFGIRNLFLIGYFKRRRSKYRSLV